MAHVCGGFYVAIAMVCKDYHMRYCSEGVHMQDVHNVWP